VKKDEYATQEHCTEIAKKIGTTAMSIIVENCGHFPQGKSQSYITNNLLLLNKDHEKIQLHEHQ
jgi:hypothetical protein